MTKNNSQGERKMIEITPKKHFYSSFRNYKNKKDIKFFLVPKLRREINPDMIKVKISTNKNAYSFHKKYFNL